MPAFFRATPDVPPVLATALPLAVPAVQAPTPQRLRVAAAAGLGTVAFLGAYAALHLAHRAHLDPRLLVALSPIPLFARCLACGATGVMVAGLATVVPPRRSLRILPGLLLVVIALFAAVILALE